MPHANKRPCILPVRATPLVITLVGLFGGVSLLGVGLSGGYLSYVGWQKRPTVEAKETYYRAKRDLL